MDKKSYYTRLPAGLARTVYLLGGPGLVAHIIECLTQDRPPGYFPFRPGITPPSRGGRVRFHLRLTPEAYNWLKAKGAAEFVIQIAEGLDKKLGHGSERRRVQSFLPPAPIESTPVACEATRIDTSPAGGLPPLEH